MKSYQMKVSKKENGEYVTVGQVEVFYPLLSELGLASEPSSFDDEGFPVYADERIQYVFDAVLASVKATARNRLVSGTANLKPDNTIADSVEALLATGERSGEALANRRDYFKAFKEFLTTLGKSAAYVAGMFDIASNVKNLPYQSEGRKNAVRDLVASHAATLTAEQIGKWERTMLQVTEATNAADPLSE